MAWSLARFWTVAAPIAESPAFSRLRKIAFLGILSPAYRNVVGAPLVIPKTSAFANDRTRAHHSFAVASLAGRIVSTLGLSPAAVDYATAWGLLHDLAAWPLSHTGEAAFSHSTQTSSNDLRRMMIFGSDRLPQSLSVYTTLKSAGLDHGKLVALFDKREHGFDEELALVHTIIHSALTPDTLEGMHRSGKAFGVQVPKPDAFVDALERDLITSVNLKKSHSSTFFTFWRSKARIYTDYINEPRVIGFESTWSRLMREHFADLSLAETLTLQESEVIHQVMGRKAVMSDEILRYKNPLRYSIAENYTRRKAFDGPISVDGLSKVFVKQETQAL